MISTNLDLGPDGQVTFGDLSDLILQRQNAFKMEFSGITRAGKLAGQATPSIWTIGSC